MTEKIKIMVIDQSVLYRQFLSEVLAATPDVEVAAVAANEKIALAKMALVPVDLILLDVEMERGRTPDIMKSIRADYPEVSVIALSTQNSSMAEAAIKALEMGALDLLPKPDLSADEPDFLAFRSRLEPIFKAFFGKKHVQRVKRLTENKGSKSMPLVNKSDTFPSEGRILTPAPSRVLTRTTAAAPLVVPQRIDVVALAVSTGGPKALAEVLPRLPGHLGVPVFVVQHMPPVFTRALADNLNRKSALDIREASESGEEVLPNRVYIAPGGKHMLLRAEDGPIGLKKSISIALNMEPPVKSCRPSADVLFRSLAEIYGGHILAVIMTGMGNDGVDGVRFMKNKGCYCLTQSEETCVVYGMPRAVDESGLSDEIVALNNLAARIVKLVTRSNGQV